MILTRNWRRLSGKDLGREINGADRTVKGSFIRNIRINYYNIIIIIIIILIGIHRFQVYSIF